MKKQIRLAAAGCALLLAGCLFPRYTQIAELEPDKTSEEMTLEQASEIVRETLASVPAGHHPVHPGDQSLGKNTTAIQLSTHNRTGLVLVEVKEGKLVTLEFYVRSRPDGEKFAAAVWRLRKEYKK